MRLLRLCHDRRPQFRVCHIVDEDGRALCFDGLARGTEHSLEECDQHSLGTRCRRCVNAQAALEAWEAPDVLPED